MKFASCKSAFNTPVVYSTDRSKAVVPVLVLLLVAYYEAICFMSYLVLRILFLCFSVLLALRLPRLGKRELILVLVVRLFDLCLFGFVCFLFLLVSGKGCGLWLRHSLDFFLTFFFAIGSSFLLLSMPLEGCDFGICGVYFFVGSSSLLLLVPREGCDCGISGVCFDTGSSSLLLSVPREGCDCGICDVCIAIGFSSLLLS